jgi:hypothetical protein
MGITSMGQRKITIELTEYQAKMLRWAIDRAVSVAPQSNRTGTGWRKLLEAQKSVLEATEGLGSPDMPLPPLPKVRTTRRPFRR